MAAAKGRAGERSRDHSRQLTRHAYEINRLSRSSLSEERKLSQSATSGADSSDAGNDSGKQRKAKKGNLNNRCTFLCFNSLLIINHQQIQIGYETHKSKHAIPALIVSYISKYFLVTIHSSNS